MPKSPCAGWTVHLAAALCATAIAGFPSVASGQSKRHQFDIPAGPLAESLEKFAEQSGRQILFASGDVAKIHAPRIKGTLDDAEALAWLLREGGLVIASDNGITIILHRRSPSSSDGAMPKVKRPSAPKPTRQPTRIVPPVTLAAPDIVVTAMKRRQTVASVPEAMTVLTGDQLAAMGVHTALDLQNVVPSLATNSVEHGVSFNIRGITTTDITSKGDQGVALNIDGIFIGRPIEQAVSLFDLDRIEVLRGPQGTLYGKSSTGGAINIVTNKPVDHWEGYVRAELGNYAARRVEAAINTPITEWLAVRAAGNLNKHAGYLVPTDDAQRKSSQDDRTARLSANAHISPAVDARLTFTAGHVGGSGTGYAMLGNFVKRNNSAAKRSVYPNPFPAGLDHHFLNIDGQVDADLGTAQLTYVGGRQQFNGLELSSNNNDPRDPNSGNLPFDPAVQLHGRFRTNIASDYHELRLASIRSKVIDYVVGANYFHERIDENDHTLSAPLGNPDETLSSNAINVIGATFHSSYGIFGQATAHLNERLGLIAGLRYSQDSVKRAATAAFGRYDAEGNACLGPADCIGNSASGRAQASKVTYRAGVNFQLTPYDLFYSSIATGYKAGGFNDATTLGGKPTPYEPEQLTAYEIGYKGRPLADITFEMALFYYDYEKTQLNGVIFLNGTGVLNTRVVPTVIYGWETAATWNITPRTKLGLSTTFERSHYVRFQAGYLQNFDWSGLPLDRVPTFSAMTTFDQTWNLPDDWSLRLRLLSKFNTHYYVSDFTSGVRFRQKAFTRSDASLTLEAPHANWYVQAFVQNIEDGLQATSPPQNYDPAYPNAAYLNISDPRLFGLRLGANFR